MEFGVKNYGVFREVTCAVSRSCGSAAPVQVITASFRTAMASLCGVAINTHPTPPGVTADAPNILNPFQAL
jgi:3-deoxy-D-manno-octulosonic acid (KDO) 8-phosphate synthase